MSPDVESGVEVERTYDVPADLVVPDLADVPGVAAVTAPERYQLEATYHDTADLRLRAAGLTLRHRSGGTDAGWHLKRPADGGREELRVQAPGDAVPDVLVALVRQAVGDGELAPRARVSTVRTVRRLLDERGVPLAELADDLVTTRRLRDDRVQRWREWEVELLGGRPALLDAVEQRLLSVGARPSRLGSKSGRALADPPVEP